MSCNENETVFSCVDCAVTACRYGKDNYPSFCLTKAMSEEEKKSVLPDYLDDEMSSKCAIHAATTEGEYYGEMARVEETMEFARRIGVKKIGLAYCTELAKEAELYIRILRLNGFEVVAASCKIGELDEGELLFGEPNGRPMCNPIGQAMLLNREKTEFNILMGLCVGCDTLFFKNTETVTTIMINKDRLTCNNTAVTLYRPERRKLV